MNRAALALLALVASSCGLQDLFSFERKVRVGKTEETSGTCPPVPPCKAEATCECGEPAKR